jgi:hypothetical protein
MNDTKKQLKNFTITMASGIRYGGKFLNEAQVLKAYAHCTHNIVKIEQRNIWTPEEQEEMDQDKAWHRAR